MRFEDENGAAWVCPATMQPVHRTTTAERQRGSISYEGRSKGSKAWLGGAAYAIRCDRCGLEPERPGFASKCLCTCTQCFRLLNGHKVCPSRFCGHNQPIAGSGVDDGRPRSPEELEIATVHVKVKRRRPVARVAAAQDAAVDAVVVVSDDDVGVSAADDAAVDAVVVGSDDGDGVSADDDAAENVPKCFSLPSQHEDDGDVGHIPQFVHLPNLLLS